MHNTRKISFSIPKGDLEMLEKTRKRMGLTRSAFIDMAIRFWLNWKNKRKLIKCYEDGYKKLPEEIQKLKAIEKAESEVLTPGEEW